MESGDLEGTLYDLFICNGISLFPRLTPTTICIYTYMSMQFNISVYIPTIFAFVLVAF